MVITQDVYDLKLFKQGMPVSEFLRNSSNSYLEELQRWNLVTVDDHRRIFLTDRGQVAKKMGLKKFVEIEEFEKELSKENPHQLLQKNQYLTGLICLLNIILMVVLVYIYWRAAVI